MKVDPSIMSALRREGVALIPDLLPRAEALAMRPLLQQAIDEDLVRWEGKPGYIDQWMVHNLMVRGLPFLRLVESAVLHAYLDEMLSNTCILYSYTSSSMPPRGTNYSRRIHVDCPRVIPGYVTNVGVTLALDDFTDENGATEVLLDSQWRTDVPTESEFNEKAVRFKPKAGQAIIFNARTWHRGGINRTNEPRHALTINACRSFMRQRFDYPRLVPPDVVAQLRPIGRRFLGFNVRAPTSLDEYYLPEEERLYKAGQG